MTSAGVDDNDFKFFGLEFLNTIHCELNRVRLRVATKERNLRFRRILFELVKSTSAESIRAYKGSFPSLCLIMVRQLVSNVKYEIESCGCK